MKKISLTIVISILSLLSFAQIPTNGLVAYYPFNGNANDESGNGHNGTVSGSTLTIDRFGTSNSAYSFDGINDYINCGTGSIGVSNRISVCYWIKLTNSFTTPNRNIIDKYNHVEDRGFVAGITPSGYVAFSGRDGNNEFSSSGITTTSLFDSQWHFLVGVCDSNYWKIYVDGVLSLQNNTNNVNTSINSSEPLIFGTMLYLNDGFFLGLLDDIRIYNRVLNSSEITAIYNEPQCVASVPVVNEPTACGSSTFTLTATGGTSYYWYNSPNGGSYFYTGSTYTTPLLTTSTTYYVSNHNGTCESQRDTVTVTINPLPNLSFIDLNTGYCVNSISVSLSASPSGGVFSGNGISGDLFTPASAGIGTNNISYSYTNSSTGCSKTISQNVTINNSPSLSISGLNPNFNINASPVTLYGSPSGGTFVGNGVSGNTFTPSVAGAGSHTVVYIYTDGNGCSNAYCETTDISTSKSEILTNESDINVYPNPNSGSFNVSFLLNKSEKVNIKVVNNFGEIIYTESNRKAKGNYDNTINLSSQPDGIYYVEVEVGERIYSEIISLVK